MKTLLAALAATALLTPVAQASVYPVDQFAVPYGALAIGEFLCGLPSDSVEKARQAVLQKAVEDGHSTQSVVDAAYPAAQRMSGYQGADKQSLCVGLQIIIKRTAN